MLNKIYIGFSKKIELPKGSFLFIDDEVPKHPKAKIFDPLKDKFNPLKHIDKKKARDLAEVLYTISPQGENTLTVRNGRRAFSKSLSEATRLDELRVESDVKGVKEEVEGMIDELLFTDIVRNVVCSDDDFAFTGKNRKIFARINRAELGEYDALILGLLLIANYRGQLIIPDFGFYGRDIHTHLIREERLIAGINFLDELPEKLRQTSLLVKDKEPHGTTYEDAKLLAGYAHLIPNTNEYNDFVQSATS